jgi:hypothetical protein
MQYKHKLLISGIAALLIAALVMCLVYFFPAANRAVNVAADDIKAAYERGYNDYAGDLEYYKNEVERLKAEIVENDRKAEEKYNNMVAYYEAKITRLENEMDTLIDYLEFLESYIVDLEFNFSGDDNKDLALQELRLKAWTAIAENYENDIAEAAAKKEAAEGERDDYLSMRDDELPEIIYYTNYINNFVYDSVPLYIPDTWQNIYPPDFDPGIGWIDDDFGDTIEREEYDFVLYQLSDYSGGGTFYAPDMQTQLRSSYPSNAGAGTAATNYWGGAAWPFKTDEQIARRDKFLFGHAWNAEDCSGYANSLVSAYIDYYYRVRDKYISLSSDYEFNYALLMYHQGEYDNYDRLVREKSEEIGGYNEIIATSNAKLKIANDLIEEINDTINNIKNGLESGAEG